MNQDIRRELISKNLNIKPINHGQVYTFQIEIAASKKQSIPLERRKIIEQSLLSHQSNLISLLIRRINNPENEEIEYELVYGADWLQIAQELEIEKVWAWVFDMTDEQAISASAEMESLTKSANDRLPPVDNLDAAISSDITVLMDQKLDQKLQLAIDSMKTHTTSLVNGLKNNVDEKFKTLNYRIDPLSSHQDLSRIEPILEKLETILEKLDAILQKGGASHKRLNIEKTENPINLLTASDQEIEMALRQSKTQDKQINAAIAVIHYWKQSDRGLTWQNLERSAKAKSNSSDKIAGFADKTYERLQAVANIPEE